MTRMNWPQVASFLSGLIFTSIIYAGILFLFVFATFSFSGEKLSEKEARDAVWFYTTLITTGITLFIIVRHIKNKNPHGAAGVCIPFLFALYALIGTGVTYFNNLNYFCAFDKARWEESEWKPFNMAKTLVKNKALVGRTKQEIIENMGMSDHSYKNENTDYIYYATDNSTWELRIYFKNNKVSEAYIYQEGLSL